MIFSESKVNFAAFCNLFGVIESLRKVLKDLPHLLLTLQIKLIVRESHPIFIVYTRCGLDRQENIMGLRIFAIYIVNIVGADHRYSRFFGKARKLRIDPRFFFQTLILQFQIKMIFPEDFVKFEGFSLCSVVISIQKRTLHLARKTRGESDYPGTVFPQYILVYPRLIVKAFGKSQ